MEKGWWALYTGGLALHLADGGSGAAEGQPWFGTLQALVSPGKETSPSGGSNAGVGAGVGAGSWM